LYARFVCADKQVVARKEPFMHRVLLLGAGTIGRVIAKLLAETGDYWVRVGDNDPLSLRRLQRVLDAETLLIDAARGDELVSAMHGCDSVVSALSFRFNPLVAQAALQAGASYFDLTEDYATAQEVRRIAAAGRSGQIFMPQCGLAPGFIAILAHHLTQPFDTLDAVHMRVGALPRFPTNALNYNLTWSTDGLINEYCNPCQAIHEGRLIEALPLEGCESFSMDGVRYEAFNTSGGLGTLCETLQNRVRELNYRTIRYMGHRDLMAFLLNDLRLSRRREVLKDILEKSIPITYEDVVVIFCTVTGWQEEQFIECSDARKIYNQNVNGQLCSAIQITTAAGICAALDLHVAGRLPAMGFVKQEQIDFDDFLHNRFGRYYASQVPARSSQIVTDVSVLSSPPGGQHVGPRAPTSKSA
jgi:saccharopine dehydrogenase-like NADP-dependent oxidoreductase